MTKTIEKIWNGDIEPLVHSGVNNPDIKEIARLVSRNRENLEANLNEN